MSDSETSGEQVLDDVIASYLKALDVGQLPDRQDILARYPDLAPELGEFFADHDRLFGKPPQALDAAAADGLQLCPAEARREPIGVGSVIAGRYRVFDVKSGGMGRVYLAEDLDAGRPGVPLKVAIKTVTDFGEWHEARTARGASADAALYTNLLARFRREAMAWVRLGMHPNIIWAMWVIEVGAKPYLVMEYADSGDLRAWIKERRLTVPLTVNFAIQFCEGMKYAANAAGVVHRDIKPANVLIKDNRILKIADFGLAKAFDPYLEETAAVDSASPDYTLSEAGAGTRAYMAPEQFRSLRLADTRSDIFSFGATLYEMLTGVQLFASKNAAEMGRLAAPIPGAHEVNASVPPDLSAVVGRCLNYDAARRYQSFDDLLDVLSRINETLPGRLPIPTDAQHAARVAVLTPSLEVLGETYSLISLGRWVEAAACAQKGIEIAPNDFQHWVNKGKALLELQDLVGARECFTRATELRPADTRSWSNLGFARLALNDTAGGLAAAMRAIAIDDGFGEAWMCRGLCERELNRMDEAVLSLQRAVKLEPHNWKAYANLGFCLKDLRRDSEAFDALTRVLKINPHDAQCWLEVGWLHASVRSWKEAREAIDQSLQLEPRNAAAWAMRGWVLWAGEHNAPAAIAALEESEKLEPGNHRAQVVMTAIQDSPGEA